MKIRGKSVVIALALMMLAVGSRAQDVEPLAIGSALPLGSAQLQTTTGEPITLSGQRGEKGLLVVFTCNTCPWVAKWEDRYVTVAKLASELGVGFVALNANEAQRSGEESLEAMRDRAAASGYTFPYAVDQDSRLADAFGAMRTPDAFLFDERMTLVYRGAIDDNARDAAAAEENYLIDALRAMVAGDPPPMPVTKSIGCTIKRKRA